MASKWFWAIFLLALASLIFALIIGPPKVKSTENDIRSALSSAGYENIDVNMSGHVAKLSGEAASADAKSDILRIARDTECSTCRKKKDKSKVWKKVKDDITVKKVAAIPTQSPYTFSGTKAANGSVVLSGYVPSKDSKADILEKANAIFDGRVTDRTIKIAAGAPDANFQAVSESYMNQLEFLDQGRFNQEDHKGWITGTTSDASIRDRINAVGAGLPAKYASGFNSDIKVPAAPVVAQSQTDCQELFDGLNRDNKIQFETNRANIKGESSYDLLNKLAAAAKECAAFRININGHTDSVGDANYNLNLSQARADTVRNYLASQQVDINRLTSQGFGETDPIATNSTREGRAQNRRITFTVTQAQ